MATILGDSGVIGSFGTDFAALNQHLFGYISFIYLFVLGFGLFSLYRRGRFDMRCTEVTVAYILLFFSLQIFQAIIGSGELRGMFGANFVDFTVEYIGYFGVWVFFMMSLVLSMVMILDKSVREMGQPLKQLNFRLSMPLLPRRSTADEESVEEVPERTRKVRANKHVEKMKDDEITDADLDTPAYLRRSDDDDNESEEEPKIRLIKRSDETQEDEEAIFDEDISISFDEEKPRTIVEAAKRVKSQKQPLVVNELEENKKLLDQIETG
ncbi:DNA translocase FtsK 4TM domain-containing protein, partial [bacterium]|nr:DNA translocase FtsK 4TM domain-containing protein [bacterium]